MEYCARFSGGPIGLALLCQLLLMTDNTGSCVTLFASAGSACVRKGTYARQLRVGGLPTQTERPDSDLTVTGLQIAAALQCYPLFGKVPRLYYPSGYYSQDEALPETKELRTHIFTIIMREIVPFLAFSFVTFSRANP